MHNMGGRHSDEDDVVASSYRLRNRREETTYRNTVRVLLTNALGLSLTLLEGVLVLELGSHTVGCGWGRCSC